MNINKDKKEKSNDFIRMPREKLTFGQKAADRLSNFCGSWKFIILVLTYIFLWILLNLIGWGLQWDPWPFIILNLTLSCLAALQAPVILMSQNRQTQRDRLSQRYDYLVDRKTSREVSQILKELSSIKRKLNKTEKK